MRIALLAPCLLIATISLAAPVPTPKDGTPVDGPYDVTLTVAVQGPPQELLLDWQSSGGVVVTFTDKGVTVTEASPKGRATLASRPGMAYGPVRLRRRSDHLEVQCPNGLLRAWCDRPIAGVVAAAQGTRADDLRVQPVEPPAFHDDFFDPEGGEAQWEPVSGQWSIGTYRDPLKAIENRPIAASWYQAKADGPAISLTGQDFWEHYRLRTGVLAVPGLTTGLVFYYQDKDNHCVFSVRPGADGQGIAELTTVQQGKAKTTPLPLPGLMWRPGNWHELALQTDGGALLCSVDGLPSARSYVPLAGGRVGLLADGQGEARFDDFDVRPADWCVSGGSLAGGDWIADRKLWSDDCGALTAKAKAFAPALWRRAAGMNTMQAEVRDVSALSGVLVNWRNGSGYRLGLDGKQWSLAEVTAGKVTVLDQGPCPSKAPRLSLSHVGGRLEASVGTIRRVRYDFTHGDGGGGIFACGGAKFGGLEARTIAPAPAVISTVTGVRTPMPGENSDTNRFVLGYLWTPSGGSWGGVGTADNTRLSGRPYGQTAPGALWYYKPCPGDADMTLEGLQLNPGASAGLALSCDNRGYQLGSGYRAETDGKALKLFRVDKVVAEKPLAKAPTTLRFWRDGRWLVALADGTPVAFEDPQPLPGSLCAAYATGAGLTARQVTLANRQGTYYAFKSEETDWQPAEGEWSTHTGMACIAWDYWYTAKGKPQALSWQVEPKLALQHLDGWVAEYTDGYADGEHHHYPYHDISLVMNAHPSTGSGSLREKPELDGGYRFLIAGEGGTVTKLLRLGQVVAETRDSACRIVMGSHCNSPRDIHFIVHREGGRLTLQLNDRMALDWTDPQPLPPGQLGIGTTGCAAIFRDIWMVRD